MAATPNILHGLKIALIVLLFISSLPFLPFKSEGKQTSSSRTENMQQREMVLGSRPPGCANKCLNCRPCRATLVIPPHDQIRKKAISTPLFHREEDSYYLLSWKCRCGDKIFHP